MKKPVGARHRPSPETPVNLIIEQYPQDTIYRIKGDPQEPDPEEREKSPRGSVTRFSEQSRTRCRLVLRSIAPKMKMVFGLTYPADFPNDGLRVKRNLGALLDWFRRRGIEYFWIIEWQDRGAPHFHGFLTGPKFDDQGSFVRNSFVGKAELAAAWNRIVSADRPEYLGDPAHLEHGTFYEIIEDQYKLASYYTTYMKKLEQKTVPPGYESVGRYWGYSRSLMVKREQVVRCTYREAMRLLRIPRKRYKARCRSWGIRWKHYGLGFTEWDEKNEIDKGVVEAYNGSQMEVKINDSSQSEFCTRR